MKSISKFTKRFLHNTKVREGDFNWDLFYNTKVREGDFNWDLYDMDYELTDQEEALRQLNGLIESIATGNDTYTLESFKSDVKEAIQDIDHG
jgi:hypothetical protein|tara:strand:+ start:374 stop:649 length:276 start_codon:yes stop_codon:yes gene_type:complete